MSAQILDGKQLAADIHDDIKRRVAELQARGVDPTLAIVVATDDESAHYYVRHITKAAASVGITAELKQLSASATQSELGEILTTLASDKSIHGIILQTPLPNGIQADVLRELIPPEKDIDGANPVSAGRLLSGDEAFAPSTAAAVMHILKQYAIDLVGKRVVIVGRSLVVGKPVAHLLLAANATVTICHSKTTELASVTKEADILVVAIGRPLFIGAEHVKPAAIVIDVGTNVAEDGRLLGDVDAVAVEPIAGMLTPVPGGVGPVTTALLLQQTVQAADKVL